MARKSGFWPATSASEPGMETTSGMPSARLATAPKKPLGRSQWAWITSGRCWRHQRSVAAVPAAKNIGASQ
jgi:hypothetical protein